MVDKETADAEEILQPLPQEQLISFQMPAAWVNRFVISATKDNIRLTFLEQSPSADAMFARCAIAFNHEDALDLAELLTRMVSQWSETNG